jgi:DNA-binding NtrC family response regulator
MWGSGPLFCYSGNRAKVLILADAGDVGLSGTLPVQVLIVEADEAFRRNISERLTLEGAMVFEAGGEAEARDIAQNHNIDVVLLGGKGVMQSGLALLRLIKETRPLTEVILMTSAEHHSLYVSMEAMKLGAFDDLLIPFDIKTLLDRIHAASRHKKEKEQTMRRDFHGE